VYTMGAIMYGIFRTLHDMFRSWLHMYPHTVIYFVSCTLDLCSPYVASEMTNSNLFQKIQNFPKNPKISKKAQICQKSPNFPKKPKFAKKAKFWLCNLFLALAFFLKILAFCQFWLFWPILAFLLFWKFLDFM
jgi:hypothetical protein